MILETYIVISSPTRSRYYHRWRRHLSEPIHEVHAGQGSRTFTTPAHRFKRRASPCRAWGFAPQAANQSRCRRPSSFIQGSTACVDIIEIVMTRDWFIFKRSTFSLPCNIVLCFPRQYPSDHDRCVSKWASYVPTLIPRGLTSQHAGVGDVFLVVPVV